MKPKPFVSLNHFTVPVAIRISPLVRLRSAGPAPSSPATVRAFVYRDAKRRSREHPVSRHSCRIRRPRAFFSGSRAGAGHLADRTDEHLARLGAVRPADDPV